MNHAKSGHAGVRWLTALMLLSGCVTIAAAATAVVSVELTGREQVSTTYYASDHELLSINYTAGTSSRVYGSGEISTGNTQDWVVYARDGSRRIGTIADAEIPLWILGTEWSCSMSAEAVPSGCGSKHRALAGQYAVVRGDLAGDWGQEYDVFHKLTNPATNYTFIVPVEDVNYTFAGSKMYDGGFSLVAGGPFLSNSNTILGATFDFRYYNRGWMSLQSNSSTSSVKTNLNDYGGYWEGQADAYDLGTSPATWIAAFPLS